MPAPVETVDEVAEVVGRSHRRERRVVPRHLIAPRARERVVHHRQQLDVREAEVLHVRRELVGELPPPETAAPRRRVYLVDRERAGRAAPAPAAQRSSRRPTTRSDDSSTTDAVFGGGSAPNASGSAFSAPSTSRTCSAARRGAVDDALPDPRRVDGRQEVGRRIPAVEVPDHADARARSGPTRRSERRRRRRARRASPTAARDGPRARARRRARRTPRHRTVSSSAPEPAKPAPPLLTSLRRAYGSGQTGTSSWSMRTMPATGIWIQSGRWLSS